jgi:alkylation response protein AidB-like acyl-CoA dehydrogenase
MEVVDSRGDGLRLNGVKANVMNANNANLFLVFAKHKLDEKTVRNNLLGFTLLKINL